MSEINGLDENDIGLKKIFGDRFHDETENAVKEERIPTPVRKPARNDSVKKAKLKPADADWEPVEEKPGQMDRLKRCAKSVLCFGCLSLLFFFWQQTGQMAMTASMPCIVTCVAIAGFGVGKAFGGR